MKIIKGAALVVGVLVIGYVGVVWRVDEHKRGVVMQQLTDAMTRLDRNEEDRHTKAQAQREDCRLKDELFDAKEELAGTTDGPLAEATLKSKDLGKRCSGLGDVLDRGMDELDQSARRDLEDSLELVGQHWYTLTPDQRREVAEVLVQAK